MNLITNRTESAVYSYTDLNRVERAVAQIAEQLRALGIGEEEFITKTDWGLPEDFSVETWPVQSQMKRYIGNVQKIKAVFPCAVRLPASMENLNWIGANNIERVLQIACSRIDGIRQAYRYSGEVYAGEELL